MNRICTPLLCLLLLAWRVYSSVETRGRHRLALGDFSELNQILRDAVLRLPGAEFSSDGAKLKLSNVRCRDLAIGDVDLRSRQNSMTSVGVDLEISNLDMFCRADYQFSAWWLFGLNGGGTADIRSLGNDAILKGEIRSVNFMHVPPEDIEVLTCNPSVYINEVYFSNGGLFGNIMNIFRDILAGFMESQARSVICAQLRYVMEDTEGLLKYAKKALDEYKPNNGVVKDPLQAEKNLPSLQTEGKEIVISDDTNLLNFTGDATKFAGWVQSSLNRVINFLGSPAEDPITGAVDMNANIILRQKILENGALELKSSDLASNGYDSVVYEGHNRITKTSVVFDSVRMVGLDSLTEFQPLDSIGDYTFQNHIAWDYLGFQIQATIQMTPSTMSDSIIDTSAGTKIEEKIDIFVGFHDMVAEMSMISLFDQDLLGGTELGSLFEKDGILPCLLSTVLHADITSFSVDVTDVLTPAMSGFVSPGIDRVFSSSMEAGFLMYEKIVLNAAPRFFQEKIRPILSETFVRNNIGGFVCAPSEWSGAASDLMDFRDLLLRPPDAVAAGATGLEPYGDVFSSFLMPYLKTKVFQGDIFNVDHIRPFTESQSGTEGGLSFDTFFQHHEGPSPFYDSLVLTVSDLWVQDIDTVVGPMSILDPIDWNRLSNTIAFDGSNMPGNKKVTIIVRIAVKIGGDDSPLKMQNTLDLSLSIPSSTLSFEIMANLRESSVINFPLFDLMNYHCWLASFDSSTAKTLIFLGLSLDVDSFQLGSACLACSSPGMGHISEILQHLEMIGFNLRYQDGIIAMLVQMITDFTQSFDIEGLIDSAPKHCPHHPSYDPAADVEDIPWPGLPALRSDSAETVIAIGVVAFSSGLIVCAKNHLLLAEEGAERLFNETTKKEHPQGSRMVNFTTIDKELGSWAGFLVEETRDYLKGTAKQSAEYGTRSGWPRADLQVNEMLREHVLDSNRAYTLNFNEIGFAALNLDLKLSNIKLYGLDSISAIEPLALVSTLPQRLKNNVLFENLLVIFEVHVISNSGIVKPMTISYGFRDINVQVDIDLALDLAHIEGIQLGSIFDMGRIFPCAVSGIQSLKVSTLDFGLDNRESIEDPVIDGYFSENNHQSIQSITQTLFGEFREDLVNAAPLLSDSTLREILNAMLPKMLESRSSQCLPPANYSSTATIDFRDLLLSESLSSSFGGTGKSPYGDLFRTMYDNMQEKMLQLGASERPLINDLFRQFTDGTGSISFQGNVSRSGRIVIAGLDAIFEATVSDIAIQNIDSVGDPLDIFQPVLGESNILNTTISFGVDSKPLQIAGKLLLSLYDHDDIQMRNEMTFAASLENVVLIASLLLKLSEESFAAFPLRDLTNIHCWLSMILSKALRNSPSILRGIDLVNHSLSVESFSLDFNCTLCSSPRFDELLSSLYNFSTSKAIDTIQHQTNNLLNSDFTQVYLDSMVDGAASKCPHRPEFDPNALQEELLLSTAETLGLLQKESVDKPIYFTLINSAIAGLIFIFGVLCRWIVSLRNRRWVSSLSPEGHRHLELQREKEKRIIEMIDQTTSSLFNCDVIPKRVRYGVPLVLALNLGLLLGAHLGVLYVVDVDASLAGESFTVNNFLELTFLESTRMTYQNGGAEMVITIWIFTIIWPYIKIFTSLAVWMAPPQRLGIANRGRILLWIDAAAKLSIVDIFTMVMVVALLLVFVGGPDETYVKEDMLYSLKARTTPGVGFYCFIIAQRISRTSSRFFLEYHELAIQSSYEGRGKASANTEEIDGNSSVFIAPKNGHFFLAPTPPSDISGDKSRQPQRALQDEESSIDHITSQARHSDHDLVKCEASSTHLDGGGHHETTGTNKKETRWGIIGVYFGATTITLVFIIGAIFAPSISLDASALAALAIESDLTREEVVQNYGVFLVLSGVLLKARFVFDNAANYVGFGFLLFVAVVSIGAMFIMKGYHFIKQKIKARQSPHQSTRYIRHRGGGKPHYTRLTKWRYMEIYIISLAVGVWQLGALSSYSIHMYCEILNRMFMTMAFIGLAENSPSECHDIQASLPENFGIILGSFFVLLLTFLFQAYGQYKKNILNSLRWIENEDIPRLSLAWSQDKTKHMKYSFFAFSSRTTSMSWESTKDSMGICPEFSNAIKCDEAPTKAPSIL